MDGAATFDYPNDQALSTLFFHDHTLGITAENIKMGMYGPYALAGNSPDGILKNLPAGQVLGPLLVYDVPIVIADRSFDLDTVNNVANFADGDDGNTMVANGKTWPYMKVQARRYRFRFVDATNSVFLSLS